MAIRRVVARRRRSSPRCSSRKCGSNPPTRRTLTAIVSCCRRAMPRRSCTRRGPRRARFRARSCSRCGRWDRISKGIRLRGFRSSTWRPDRSGRASAQAWASRSTPVVFSRSTAPTCCWATANRLRARSGKPRMSPRSTRSTICAASRTSTRSARAARRCGSTTWSSSPAAGAPSAGTPSSSTATI